ncbi:phage portal protein [Shewanella surugensis]|uniref:Phage portal protein n=1 Tax=Shewanella surugensis TaxID=212020 RepID=A0ABT0L8Y7_9GAMM|nr:phage portal protein [Shewanella surugensis]MCL1124151.1 phage portal protein [Shewanella surugensis]
MNNQLLAPDGVTSLREEVARQNMVFRGAGAGFGGQLMDWNPQLQSVDAALLPVLPRAQARADDVIRNNGIAANAIQLHQDHIIGSEYRLSYKPNWHLLGIKPDSGFVRDVEAVFRDIAEDPNCYIDAERKRTFTMMMRESVAMHASSGDVMAKPEMFNDVHSPFSTCIRLVSPKCVTNPNHKMSTEYLKGGIELNRRGQEIAIHIEQGGHQFGVGRKWRRVNKRLANGRIGFIHVFEPTEAGQTRGVNKFLSSLEQLKMLDTLQNTTLQQAIVAAMYAASIESELGTEEAMEFLAGTSRGGSNIAPLDKMLAGYGDYYAKPENNIKLGGVKVPHLLPNDKFNIRTPGNMGAGFADLEKSILRYVAAGTGLDYAQLSKNYSQMSYSTIRASMNDSHRYFMGGRKIIANPFANQIFELLFEEMLIRKYVTLPKGARYSFQQRRHAWTRCDWIGSGRMAIDGLKEVKEAVLLIESGLSTYEEEAAKLGKDYQELFAQQVREVDERKKSGLPPPSYMKTEQFSPAEQGQTDG